MAYELNIAMRLASMTASPIVIVILKRRNENEGVS